MKKHVNLSDPDAIKHLSEEQIGRIKLEQEHEGNYHLIHLISKCLNYKK